MAHSVHSAHLVMSHRLNVVLATRAKVHLVPMEANVIYVHLVANLTAPLQQQIVQTVTRVAIVQRDYFASAARQVFSQMRIRLSVKRALSDDTQTTVLHVIIVPRSVARTHYMQQQGVMYVQLLSMGPMEFNVVCVSLVRCSMIIGRGV